MGQKHPLCPSVAFPEWMKTIGIAIEFSDMLDERIESLIAEEIHFGQPVKISVAYLLNFISRNKLCPLL